MGCADGVARAVGGLILWVILLPAVCVVAAPVVVVRATRHPMGLRVGLADGAGGVWRWWCEMAGLLYA